MIVQLQHTEACRGIEPMNLACSSYEHYKLPNDEGQLVPGYICISLVEEVLPVSCSTSTVLPSYHYW